MNRGQLEYRLNMVVPYLAVKSTIVDHFWKEQNKLKTGKKAGFYPGIHY